MFNSSGLQRLAHARRITCKQPSITSFFSASPRVSISKTHFNGVSQIEMEDLARTSPEICAHASKNGKFGCQSALDLVADTSPENSWHQVQTQGCVRNWKKPTAKEKS